MTDCTPHPRRALFAQLAAKTEQLKDAEEALDACDARCAHFPKNQEARYVCRTIAAYFAKYPGSENK